MRTMTESCDARVEASSLDGRTAPSEVILVVEDNAAVRATVLLLLSIPVLLVRIAITTGRRVLHKASSRMLRLSARART